jgi:hypothetical protein
MTHYVDVTFDCLPLRSIDRFDIPIDASPAFHAFCQRVIVAAGKHGLHNSYYLHGAHCIFHLTNDEYVGSLDFRFEGVVLTDPDDQKTVGSDLSVELDKETCDWLTGPVARWFTESVNYAVRVEFDRYIAAGDLKRTIERLQRIQQESDTHGGFLGMGL